MLKKGWTIVTKIHKPNYKTLAYHLLLLLILPLPLNSINNLTLNTNFAGWFCFVFGVFFLKETKSRGNLIHSVCV